MTDCGRRQPANPSEYRIILPPVFDAHGTIELRSSASAWSKIRSGDRGPRIGRDIRVPAWMFDDDHRVGDEPAGWVSDDYKLELPGPPTIGQGCIVIVLESPHSWEFAPNGGKARGPLRKPASRTRFRRHVAGLIECVARHRRENLASRQVVIANSIRYQASLHALMADPAETLQHSIRNCVWKALFQAGGSEALIAGLDAMSPSMVIFAPTYAVREELYRYVSTNRRRWPWIFTNQHPSVWSRSLRLLPLESLP